ncbi:MAG: tRNA (5-methylaminomethyl-2-thiouridine)(34)-methyltransferase MnmD [Bacteroidota bacterium]
MELRVINTGDGSKTLYLPDMGEQYHSVNGAVTESEYVFIEKGYRHHKSNNITVFEVGFGTGLNCLLTALEAEKQKRRTIYYTIEKYPLGTDIIEALNYGDIISEEAELIFDEIHKAPWNQEIKISDYFTLLKIEENLLTSGLNEIKNCDVIYFDAFAPDKQPDMWQPKIFNRIYSFCAENAIFVTYSAKGEVRRQLNTAGFEMERLPGPPGKMQMLRGTKKQRNKDH